MGWGQQGWSRSAQGARRSERERGGHWLLEGTRAASARGTYGHASGRAPCSTPTPGAPSSARRPALHGTNFHPGTLHAVSGNPRHGRRHWSPEVGGRAARWRTAASAAGSAAPDLGEQGYSSSWHLRTPELPGEPPGPGCMGMGIDRWDARFWANFFFFFLG